MGWLFESNEEKIARLRAERDELQRSYNQRQESRRLQQIEHDRMLQQKKADHQRQLQIRNEEHQREISLKNQCAELRQQIQMTEQTSKHLRIINTEFKERIRTIEQEVLELDPYESTFIKMCYLLEDEIDTLIKQCKA